MRNKDICIIASQTLELDCSSCWEKLGIRRRFKNMILEQVKKTWWKICVLMSLKHHFHVLFMFCAFGPSTGHGKMACNFYFFVYGQV